MYPLHYQYDLMLIPGHSLPAPLAGLSLERSGWSYMRRNPLTSGLYEVIVNQPPVNGLDVQEVILLMWNGKLWLTPAGAAVLGKSIKKNSWRGLSRIAYETACKAIGEEPIPQHSHDRNHLVNPVNEQLLGSALSSDVDDIDLFVGLQP